MSWRDQAVPVAPTWRAQATRVVPHDTFDPNAPNLVDAAQAGFERGALANASLEPGDIEGAVSAATDARIPAASDVLDVLGDSVKAAPSKVVPRGFMSLLHSLTGAPDPLNDSVTDLVNSPSLVNAGRVAGNAVTSILPQSPLDGSTLAKAFRVLNPDVFDDNKAVAQIKHEDRETPSVEIGGVTIPIAAVTQYLASAGIPGSPEAAGAGVNVAREAAADVVGAGARAAPTVGKVGGAIAGAKGGAGIGSIPAAVIGWKAGGVAGKKVSGALKSLEDKLRPLTAEARAAPKPRDIPADVMTGSSPRVSPSMDIPADVMAGDNVRPLDEIAGDLVDETPFVPPPSTERLPTRAPANDKAGNTPDWHITQEQIRGDAPIPDEIQHELDGLASRASRATGNPRMPLEKTGAGRGSVYRPEGVGTPATPVNMRASALDALDEGAPPDMPADVMVGDGGKRSAALDAIASEEPAARPAWEAKALDDFKAAHGNPDAYRGVVDDLEAKGVSSKDVMRIAEEAGTITGEDVPMARPRAIDLADEGGWRAPPTAEQINEAVRASVASGEPIQALAQRLKLPVSELRRKAQAARYGNLK